MWASTGNKNPDYEELRYVYPLIGPNTVNTLPTDTLEALMKQPADSARATITDGYDKADQVLSAIADLGLEIEDITDKLEEEAVEKFEKTFRQTDCNGRRAAQGARLTREASTDRQVRLRACLCFFSPLNSFS